MRIARKTILAALAFAAFAGTATSAAADRWVKILTNTSVAVYRFYASPADSKDWGQDRLGRKQIPSGYNSTINLNSAPAGCTYDIRAEFDDSDVLEKYGIDICGGYTITYSD
jgi:hypothetical protein